MAIAPSVAATKGINEETMLLRRVAIATFAAATLLVVACGHQVTPSPTFNNLSGDIVLKFRVNGTLDFNDYTYAVIIDTCGNGTPYPQAYKTTFNSYSYGFFVGASFGTGLPQLVEYFVSPNSSGTIQYVTVPASSSLEQFIPNDNGQGNEFELVFSRAQLDNPLNQAQPCPNIPPVTASATPTGTPGATPTATATLAPGASPSPSPTPTPNTSPTTAAQATWAFNYFTIQGSTVLDSLGLGGPTDTTFSQAIVNTQITQDTPFFKATGGTVPSNPAAQLSGGDIQNYQ
jgi:hypothetical protein